MASADDNDFVEIAGSGGDNLSGFVLLLYNGCVPFLQVAVVALLVVALQCEQDLVTLHTWPRPRAHGRKPAHSTEAPPRFKYDG